jgi:uncharacterized protein YegP (UPF0339 family)
MSRFTLYTDKNNDFRWKFIASDDQVVARSGGVFRSKEEAIQSLDLLRKDIGAATVDAVVQVHQSKGMPERVSAPSVAPVPAPSVETRPGSPPAR